MLIFDILKGHFLVSATKTGRFGLFRPIFGLPGAGRGQGVAMAHCYVLAMPRPAGARVTRHFDVDSASRVGPGECGRVCHPEEAAAHEKGRGNARVLLRGDVPFRRRRGRGGRGRRVRPRNEQAAEVRDGAGAQVHAARHLRGCALSSSSSAPSARVWRAAMLRIMELL